MRVLTGTPMCPVLWIGGQNGRIIGLFTHYFGETMSDTHKFCSQCGGFKPHAQFKRLLTRAQSKARGYVGHHRVEIDSKLCKDCQPKPKPVERLTKKEIRNRVAAGDMHPMIGEGIIKERDDTVNQRRAAKTASRWADLQHKEWQKLVYAVSREVTIVRQQQKYAQRIKDATRQAYANTYLTILNNLRAKLRFAALKPQGAPESVYWMDHLHPEETQQVRDAWEKLPLDTRSRMKIPLVIAHRAGDAEDSKPKLYLRLPDYVSPDERLANGIRIKLGNGHA